MCAGVMGYGYGNGSNSSSNSNGHVVRLRFHLVFDWIFNYSLLLVAIYLPAALLTRHTCPARVSGISTAHLCTHVRTACPGPLSRKWQRIDCVPSAAAFAFPTHQIPIASLNGIFNAKPQTSKLCWYFHDPFPPYFAFFFFFLSISLSVLSTRCGCVGHLHSCLKRAYLQIFELDLGSCKLRGISGELDDSYHL